jgi:site-specific DNA-adenine methylase
MILRFPGAKTKLLPVLRPYIDALVDGQDSFHDAFIGSVSVLLDTARRQPLAIGLSSVKASTLSPEPAGTACRSSLRSSRS